ncbi:hypothetical protein MMC16_000596 [Acarospora aff. strigata]|nr:hypothetical protein [Acarospora aff. strigata]
MATTTPPTTPRASKPATQAPTQAHDPNSPSTASASATVSTSSDEAQVSASASAAANQAKKITALEIKIAALNAQIAEAEAKREELSAKLGSFSPTTTTPIAAATQTVKQHIHLLHTYNEIRDVGSGLMGLIAEKRGCRVADVFLEFGVGGGD